MKLSRNGLIFLTCREAIVLTAYQDGKHLSIGMGSNDPNLRPGDTITVAEAFARLKRDVTSREQIVTRSLKVPVSQQQFDAMFDLYYQNGNKLDGHGRRGFEHMVGLMNAGKFEAAADYLPECKYNSAGEPKDGLLKRRLLEQSVFLRGDYGDLSVIPFYRGDPRTTPREQYHLQPGDI
jgi:GH24 family phage-related lysozyme (muramidase)